MPRVRLYLRSIVAVDIPEVAFVVVIGIECSTRRPWALGRTAKFRLGPPDKLRVVSDKRPVKWERLT